MDHYIQLYNYGKPQYTLMRKGHHKIDMSGLYTKGSNML